MILKLYVIEKSICNSQLSNAPAHTSKHLFTILKTTTKMCTICLLNKKKHILKLRFRSEIQFSALIFNLPPYLDSSFLSSLPLNPQHGPPPYWANPLSCQGKATLWTGRAASSVELGGLRKEAMPHAINGQYDQAE